MTNSAKQTKKGKRGPSKSVAAKKPVAGQKAASAEKDASDALPAYATGDFWASAMTKRPAVILGGVLLLLGWGFILHINRWHFTVPVVLLWLGWAGIIGTARFLWWAGIAMASDANDVSHEMDVSEYRLRELQDEKKILIRAIKEIEFDRDLGKMSEEDAKEIMRFYRARAIEVIKEIDGQDESDMTVPQRIERDLQARLAVATQPQRGGKDTPAQKAERIKTARANAKVAADAKAAAEEKAAEDEDANEDRAEDPKTESAESA